MTDFDFSSLISPDMTDEEYLLYLEVANDVQDRLNFIQKNISEGKLVGYYTNNLFYKIKLEELVCIDAHILVGTTFENYKDITCEILYVFTALHNPIEALLPTEALKKWSRIKR